MTARTLVAAIALFCAGIAAAETDPATSTDEITLQHFVDVLSQSERERRHAIRDLRRHWQRGYAVPLIEIMSLTDNEPLMRQVLTLLRDGTGQRFGPDAQDWFAWLWTEEEELVDGYPEFKSWLFGAIDPRFRGYFRTDYPRTIRLDEVRWGGVQQDGIPPLRNPAMIDGAAADYLEDDNVVFGLAIDGDVRAYPKRILAWHEMFVDTVGGVAVAGVYCTLCGSMILYETEVDGTNHELGTSGFLYRSNKLMYDEATQSLWSTLLGKPVIGPLVGRGIELETRSVVTTTWGEWRRRHPDTRVLSLETGYRRNYGEGVAYRSYFSTDRLMFNVPKLDERLDNKAEVLGLRFGESGSDSIALAVDYLAENPIYAGTLNGQRYVVLTDRSGASRVYERGPVELRQWDRADMAVDADGVEWRLTEAALMAEDGRVLERLPAHRAFWFGWYNAFEETTLVH